MTFLVPPEKSRSAGHGALAVVLALTLAGCGRARTPPTLPASTASRPPPATGYVAPPALTTARPAGNVLRLDGSAPGGSEVTLAAPDGRAFRARAGADGRWALSLPATAEPGLFALWAQAGPRTVRAEGAVLLLPEPGPPAVLVRAGFAALPLEQGTSAPVISAVDYDVGGGAAVAGLARPMARVRLSIDGAAAGLGQADEVGRFAVIAANRTLAPGVRRLQVETDAGRAEASAPVSAPALPAGRAYRAAREQGAWRIDWTPAGGGVQTTLVFDRPGAVGSAGPR